MEGSASILLWLPSIFQNRFSTTEELTWKEEGKTEVVLNYSCFRLKLSIPQTPLWNVSHRAVCLLSCRSVQTEKKEVIWFIVDYS